MWWSRILHQMNSKQMPFIFKTLLSVSKIGRAVYGSQMFCLFTSGSSWSHVLFWHDCPSFLAFTSHGKGCFQSISRWCPGFYKWMRVFSLWTITRDSPRMPSSPEKRGHWLQKEWNFMRRGEGGRSKYPLYHRDMLGEKCPSLPSILCRRAAMRDSPAPLSSILFTQQTQPVLRWGQRLIASFLGFHPPKKSISITELLPCQVGHILLFLGL